jgi:hypothetical protein
MESLLLFRRALASPTMCRFIPALSVTWLFVVDVMSNLGWLSGLRQLAEEVVHGAQHFYFVGTEDVVIGVGQTDDLS